MRHARWWLGAVMVAMMGLMLGGCYSHSGPAAADLDVYSRQLNGATDLREIGTDVAAFAGREPPGTIAVARMEAGSQGEQVNRLVAFTWEREKHLSRIPGVASLMDEAPLAREVPRDVDGTDRLLKTAERAGAEWLFLFTMHNRSDGDFWFPPLTVVTVGIFPNAVASVDVEGTAVVIDVAARRVIARFAETEHGWQPSNAWNQGTAQRQTAERAQRRLLDTLIDRLTDFHNRAFPAGAWPVAERSEWLQH
jgi:hypothetical protein